MICQLSGGTVLGAIKFYGILPWEIDGDISIDSTNVTALKKVMVPQLKKQGYRFVSSILTSNTNLEGHSLQDELRVVGVGFSLE